MSKKTHTIVVDRFNGSSEAPYGKSCPNVWLAVTKQKINAQYGQTIKKNTILKGFAYIDKRDAVTAINDAYEDDRWPKGTLKLVKVAYCITGDYALGGLGKHRKARLKK